MVGTVCAAVLAASTAGGLFGDTNGDGDVDRFDYAVFHDCIAGSGPQTLAASGCGDVDREPDGDVDLLDLAAFLNALTPPPVGLNDLCSSPILIGDGTQSYDNREAQTDGLGDPLCDFFNFDQVESDLWYCYRASCTGTAFVTLCGSTYDTKLAVYAGCDCPTSSPLACSDDDCGSGTQYVQSRVEVGVTQGESYMVRVGSFSARSGSGLLTIQCNLDVCATAQGDCFQASPTGDPGCGDAECCAAACHLDQYCCDVTWDSTCASEANGACLGHFLTCAPGAGSCAVPDTTPGCDDVACCDAVCISDPYCCTVEWDATCVNEASSACLLTCGPTAGDCFTPHPTPGCNVTSCCRDVCNLDSVCCGTEWDAICVDIALDLCVP